MIDKATGHDDLSKWQERFEKNKRAYEDELGRVERRDALYNGTRDIRSLSGIPAQKSAYVRNAIAEIIESEIDSTIPLPKVSAKREEDEDNAQTIEAFLRNELDLLPFEKLNDLDERTTPIQGGDYFHIEWDNSRSTHNTVGGVKVSILHPRQVIPQQGVTEIADMDYIFVMSSMTKQNIKRTYDVDVSDETEMYPEARQNQGDVDRTADDVVTLITAYYKNDNDGIGVYRWVGDTEVQNLKDYFARRLRRCKKCNSTVGDDESVCPECGSKKFEYTEEKTMPLDRDIEVRNGKDIETLKAMTDPEYTDSILFDDNGEQQIDEYGEPLTEQIMSVEPQTNEVPVYKINIYPIVLRKNISKNNTLLGGSDVDILEDLQETLNKINSKINEKLLKGGSYVTFPKGAHIKKTDEELKIIELNNISDKQMIDVLNIQPDISKDMVRANDIYQAMRELIGITDSFQGRKDSTAQSGTAKQFAAAQSAGRLESKRVQKQAAYQEVFNLIFKFMLAYADEPRATQHMSALGSTEYGQFNKYDFIERDASGELYYNDDFLFSVDTTSNMAQNREALWQAARENWQAGAYGDPTQLKSRIMYWTQLERYHYPAAGTIKQELIAEQQEQEEMMQQQQALQGGGLNAMSDMQTGNVTPPIENGGQPVQGNLQMPQPAM